ncbi:MAG TPA: GNAT family N-acetyltransferase [Gaiellaceae bacterium]
MEIVRIEDSRLGEASDVLARAFQDDPAWVWLIPDAEKRRRLLPWLFRVGFDVTAADVWTTSGVVRGAARWLPPGRPPMRVGPTLKALVTTPFRLGSAIAPFLAYGRAVEALRAEAMSDPHWYLAGIGVDPSAQRRGVGTALLEPGLVAAARAALPAVLLTNNEANLSFYERHGFVVVRQDETPKDGPQAWAMVKAP